MIVPFSLVFICIDTAVASTSLPGIQQRGRVGEGPGNEVAGFPFSACLKKVLNLKGPGVLLVYEKILYIDHFLEGWVILS